MNVIEERIRAFSEVCKRCQLHRTHIGWAHRDLNAAAKKAVRRPSARNQAQIAVAKAALQKRRDQALGHIVEEHEEAVG